MSLGIYKFGQGYWVRVMAACLIGAVTLATAGWLVGQGAIIADKLPRTAFLVSVNITKGEPKPGDLVDLLGISESGGAPAPVIGSGVVRQYLPADRVVRIDSFTIIDGHDPAETTGLTSKDGAVAAGVVARTFAAQASVEPAYIQGGLAFTAILVGAILAYWLVAMRPQTVDFLIATDMEMKKVNWSTLREIRGSTYVVIGACFTIAGLLFVFDLFFKTFFQLIGVLAK